jgi:hypothetical protein
MKNQKYQKSYESANGDSSCEAMPEEIIGNKELYNWLYQQEEEDYYLNEKISNSLSDIPKRHYL